MITVRHNKVILAVILTLICICLIPKTVDALAIKTTVAEILSNPDKYDGKMVQVDGKVDSLQSKVSKRGNAYYTFSIKSFSNDALKVFSFGSPSVKNADSVTVRGIYQKVKHVPPRFTFYNEIDASEGSVEKIKN